MKKILLIATTVSLLFASCSNDDVIGRGMGDESTSEIGFRTLMDKNTRASITDQTNLTSLTVTAWWDKSGVTPSAPVYGDTDKGVYLFNAYNLARGEAGNWDYSPKSYWPAEGKGKVDFFAYSPASSVNLTKGIEDYTGLAIEYTVPEIKKEIVVGTKLQEDFLVTKLMEQEETSNGGVVALNFKHALSRVKFLAKKGNPDITYLIKEVSLVNLASQAKLTYANVPTENPLTTNGNVVRWSDQNLKTTYTADMGESPVILPYDIADKDKAYSILGDINAIMVMPQTTTLLPDSRLEPDATDKEFAIAVSYKAYNGTYYYAGTPTTWKTKYLAVKALENATGDGITFEFGKQYNFFLTFGEEVGDEITFSVATSDWTDSAPQYVPEPTDYTDYIWNFLRTGVAITPTLPTDGSAITKADLLAVTKIGVSASASDMDFTGLEYFENLKELSLTNVKGGADLDASKNAKLTTVKLFAEISLGTVNLSNTALTKLYKDQDRGGAKFQNLDLSNTRIEQIGYEDDKINLYYTNVTDTLNLSNCGLDKIDRMPETAEFPEVLNLSNNALTSLDFSKATTVDKPKDLNLSNNLLTEVILPKRTYGDVNLSNNNFKTLEIEGSTFSNLDVSNNAALTALTTIETVVTGKLNASGNTALMNINLGKDKIASPTKYLTGTLDISDSKGLNKIVLTEGYNITTLIVWDSCTKTKYTSIVTLGAGSGNNATITNVKTKNGTVLVP